MFQFAPVLRRATVLDRLVPFAHMFQFAPVLRRATKGVPHERVLRVVSIRARLATGDTPPDGYEPGQIVFQFAPVLRRATAVDESGPCRFSLFQFAPVLRRATPVSVAQMMAKVFQFAPVLRRATRYE